MPADAMPPVAYLKGYVTIHASVLGKGVRQVEQALGFNIGALQGGYAVYALSAPVGVAEFEWKDRTRYSDGWHFDPTIGEYVQRRDELRAHLGKQNAYDETKTDGELATFMERHRVSLNVRSGPRSIVKVIPKGNVSAYPDSPFRDVPQWRLTVRKRFVLIG